ncbi:hypothetical protein SmJEL517_g03142 [Synchytrium microbalum]|uniref:Tetratricopeptide repeat protein 29 n=1 Tax=Synchytrium microbalum TaxID=1806994 RepID=A0A507C427_9FUNG|nr:uncharacterized protein SmJEL517_g03142 [Synchytrium microbalum]TPX34221.1 hypothetical protein SmJEL517_g03142 [Synchytrium microbalum]
MPLPPINSRGASPKRPSASKSPTRSILIQTTRASASLISPTCISLLGLGYLDSYKELFDLTHTRSLQQSSSNNAFVEKSISAIFGEGVPEGSVKEIIASLKQLLISVEDLRRASDTEALIASHTKLGALYSTTLSKNDFAERHYREALSLSQGHAALHVESARNLSSILQACGKPQEALIVLEGARASDGPENTVTGAMISILLGMSDEASATGSHTDAASYLTKAWSLASASNLNESAIAKLLYRRGEVALVLGQTDEAQHLLEEYAAKVVAMNDFGGEAKAWSALARVFEQKGDLGTAASQMEKYLELTKTQPELASEEPEASRKLGFIFSKMGKFEESAKFFESSISQSTQDQNATPQAAPDARACIQVGIARGSALMSRLVDLVKEDNVAALLKWKTNRELPEVVVAPAATI